MSKRNTTPRALRRAQSRQDAYMGQCPHCGSLPPDGLTFMTLPELIDHAASAGQSFDPFAALDESLSRGLFEVDGSPVWWWCHDCHHGGSMVRS
jgi:hypothetical protein